jgi:sensor c-di-GMP phosphodiesterase-like protein
VFRSTQDRWKAALAGTLLAGLPVAAISVWSNYHIENKGQAEVALAAKRAIVLAEGRISRVIAGLNELTERGISSCSPENVEAMHQTAFATTPIKEVAIVDPAGTTLCTNLGIPLGRRDVLSRPVAAAVPDFVIEVVRIGGQGESLVRVRRIVSDGRASLAALVPADLLLPKVSPDGGAFRTYARLATRDGTLIDEGGAALAHDETPADRVVMHERSEAYGLVATASMSRAALYASYAGLRLLGPAVGLVFLLLALVAHAYARHRKNPVVDLERALKANEFVPYFQPILDLASGRLVGGEVLIRWRKPDGTVLPPASFIPLAESSGLIADMTSALMRRVCTEAGEAIGRRPGLMVSFNMTAAHFADERTITEVRDLFARSPIALSQVVLEVSQRRALDDLDMARRIVSGLQDLGVRVALDDVGTGHGGLSHLLKLGVDVMKIDKLFIDAIGTERHSAAIIKSLIELAQDMRMDIVAEGVEKFEHVAYLREHGVRYAQGYAFAPPLPCASFLRLLEAADPLVAKPEQEDGPEPAPLPARAAVA